MWSASSWSSFGPGLSSLSIADRATLANMSPEFGATSTLFPVDSNTLSYLKLTGRGALIDLVERYTREQGLFRTDADPEPRFSEVLDLDLGQVEPSVAGPKRPQDRVPLAGVAKSFKAAFSGVEFPVEGKAIARLVGEGGNPAGEILESPPEHLKQPRAAAAVTHGSVVIAAITSCTNTSNPSVMIAAGLVGAQGGRSGSQCKPWVKTSLGARLARRDAVSRQGRPHAVPRDVGLQPGGLRMHDLHRQLRPVARRDRRGRDDARISPWLQSCRAIEISRGAFTRK